ncbi:META domain-containing protein [Desulforegula conservatrix]|uniref:META domain-containing protein n=1 Tax=Desulforegula conservatrix TaxID=153026 RepID=UPI00042A5692|nr:META domain-containing protein [Desulforegula conservatrix]
MTRKIGMFLGLFFVCCSIIPGCAGNLMAKNVQETITGKKWILISIAGESINAQSRISAEFVQEEGKSECRISGFSGCNMFNGKANISDKKLTVQHVSSTRKACKSPENIMQLEHSFLKALETSAMFKASDKKLEIMDSSEKPILIFESEPLTNTVKDR